MKRGEFPLDKIDLLASLHEIGYSYRALARWLGCGLWSMRWHLGAIDKEFHNQKKRDTYAKK